MFQGSKRRSGKARDNNSRRISNRLFKNTRRSLSALDEQRFEEPFQGANLLAYRRLSDLVDLRGLGKTFRLGQIAEYF